MAIAELREENVARRPTIGSGRTRPARCSLRTRKKRLQIFKEVFVFTIATMVKIGEGGYLTESVGEGGSDSFKHFTRRYPRRTRIVARRVGVTAMMSATRTRHTLPDFLATISVLFSKTVNTYGEISCCD